MNRAALAPESRVGQYRIVRCADDGPVGFEYEAEDESLRVRIALRELFPLDLVQRAIRNEVEVNAPEAQADWEALRSRFTGQFRQLARLHHPGIAQIRDVLQVNGTVYVATSWVDGENLEAWLRALGQPPTQAELDAISSTVLAALDAVHGCGLLHQDIRPEHILIRADGVPVLVGFGTGATSHSRSSPLPSHGYAAPEIYAGALGVLGPWTDFYSLGATLYRAVAGERPPPATERVIGGTARTAVEAGAGRYRQSFLDAIDRCLALRPSQRPQSAEELARLIAGGDARSARGTVVELASGTGGRALRIDEMQSWSTAIASARSGQLATRDSAMHGVDPRLYPTPPAAPAAPAPARRVAESRGEAPPMSGPAPAGSSRRSIALALATAMAALLAGAVFWLGRRDPTVTSPPKPVLDPKAPLEPRRNLPLVPPVGTADGSADTVEMTVFAPAMVMAGEAVLVQLFLHLAPDGERALVAARTMDAVTARRGTRTLDVELRRGARVDITLECKGCEIDEPAQSVRWRGEPAFAQFVLEIPAEAVAGRNLAAIARVSVDGDLIGRISFRCVVSDRAKVDLEPAGDRAGRYRYAFVSYASQDRKAVLERVQMLQATRTDFFQDVLRLDPGARWEQELYRNIDKCDLFLLFWSSSARSSEWVMKEVEYALGLQQANPERLPDIVPVVIEGPPPVLPPASLSDLHFDDRIRYFIAAG